MRPSNLTSQPVGVSSPLTLNSVSRFCVVYLTYQNEKGRIMSNITTPQEAMAAVKQVGGALQHVPEVLITPELCLEAVNQWGGALEYVPEALKTPEVCLVAVKQWGYAVQHVPEELKSPEICMAARPA